MIPQVLSKCSTKIYDAATLFLLAACLRVIYCSERFWLTGDSPDYTDIAKNLYLHNSFAFSGVGDGLTPTAFRPLLYPLFISVVELGAKTHWNLLIAQCFLGSVTVVLIYLMARESFGRFVAVTASLMLTFAPMTINYTATIATETLFTFLITLSFYLWGRRLFCASGIVFGMVGLTRPIIFPLFLFLILLIFIFPLIRKEWKNLLTIIVFALVISCPWMIRNSILFDKITLTQSSGYGTNLLYGTIETPVWGDDVWSWIIKDPLTQPSPGLDEIEQDRQRMQVAINRIKESPIRWLKVRFKQYLRLFLDSGDYVLGNHNSSVSQAVKEQNFSVILFKVSFIVINFLFYGLALLGIIFAKNRILLLPHLFVFPIFLALVHLPMWIETRYFLPAVPLVCILAAVGLQKILEKQNFIKIG